jgi:predicted Zn finger-like uncharacterized protein
MIVSCDCGAKLKVDETKIAGRRVKIRCPRCGKVHHLKQLAPDMSAPIIKNTVQSLPSLNDILVLVAHDSEVVRYLISRVLTEAGSRVEMVSNGVDALKKATELRPQGLVLDVGLPGIYGFELCEQLKGNPVTKNIKIILLSSVYDHRRYKRAPTSLYGADDYIEKHHIPDLLTVKLHALIAQQVADYVPKSDIPMRQELSSMSRPPVPAFEPPLVNHNTVPAGDRPIQNITQQNPEVVTAAHQKSSAVKAVRQKALNLDVSLFRKEECDILAADEGDFEAIEKARRFARIIVSDIALYNQEAVIEGIKKGTFFEMLKNDINEGRELYEKRIPDAIRMKKDYYKEALDNFIGDAKRKNVR